MFLIGDMAVASTAATSMRPISPNDPVRRLNSKRSLAGGALYSLGVYCLDTCVMPGEVRQLSASRCTRRHRDDAGDGRDR